MTNFPVGSPLNAPKTLFAVYDPVSFLNGFIDPSSSAFAKYDQNIPSALDTVDPSLAGQGAKLNVGPAATTAGNVGDASVGSVQLVGVAAGGGASVTTSVYNSTTSKVFLTGRSAGGGSGAFSVFYSNPVGVPNTFNISSFGNAQQNAVVNWMIVN